MVSLADCNREISELMMILKKEIKMLRAGKFQNTEQASLMKAEKTKSVAAIIASLEETTKVDMVAYRQVLAPRLAQLKSLSIENGQLLRAVLRGIKAAQDRLRGLKSQEASVGAYGREGQSLSFDEQPNSNEQTF